MGCLAVYGRLGRAALLIIAGFTSEFGSSVMSHSLLESRECDSPCRVLRGAPIASDEPVTAQLAGYRPRWSPVGMLARARCAHRGTYVAPGRPLRGLGSSDHVLCVFARIFVIISMLAISAELSKFWGKILSTPILAEKGGRANPWGAHQIQNSNKLLSQWVLWFVLNKLLSQKASYLLTKPGTEKLRSRFYPHRGA